MARLPRIERISAEQLASFAPEERLEKLLPSINGLIDGTSFLNKQLTLGDNLAAKVFTFNVDMPATDWVAMPLSNGWVNYSALHEDPVCRKDDSGLVHIKGVIKDGTVGFVEAFRVPAAYVPPKDAHLPGTSSTGPGTFKVQADRAGQIFSGSNTWFALAGCYTATDRTPVTPACFPVYQKWDLSAPPTLVWVSAIRDREDNSRLALGPMSLNWEYSIKDSAGQVKINNLLGLQYGRKYAITCVGLVG